MDANDGRQIWKTELKAPVSVSASVGCLEGKVLVPIAGSEAAGEADANYPSNF